MTERTTRPVEQGDAGPLEPASGAEPAVASRRSLEDEPHPERHPGSPGEVVKLAADEASEGDSPLDKAKRALHAIDRDISGEYERREDPTAPDVEGAKRGAGEDAG